MSKAPWLRPASQNISPGTPAPEARKVSFIQALLDRFGTPERCIAALGEQCKMEPVEGRLNLQVFLNAMGREEESFAVSNQLLEMAPNDGRVLFNQGWHWLKRGKLSKGLALLEHGRAVKAYGNEAIASIRPQWTPEKGRGHRVLLVLEGGLGDEIIHFRFGKDLVEKYDCHVVVVCQPTLATIFGRQKWVSAIAQKEAALGIYHDSWVSGMSAAARLGYEYEDISAKPYLKADEGLVEKWAELLCQITPRAETKKKIKVGIRWSGNPEFEHQMFRRFPPDILVNLRHHSEIQFYSFQRDHDLVDLPREIVDLAPHLKSWDDTAAAVSNMDLMISSCTSVAHLSAALGKKTWILVPALPYFIWAIPGTNTPWYETARLFRQAQFGSWENVRNDLEDALRKEVAE